MKYFEMQDINFYHGLGGAHNRNNDFEMIARHLKGYNPEQMDSVSLYSMDKIFESGYLKCGHLRDDHVWCYSRESITDGCYDHVFIATDTLPYHRGNTEDFRDWVSLSLSFLIDDKKLNELGIKITETYNGLVAGEYTVAEKLPIECIKAICMPLIVGAAWDSCGTVNWYLANENYDRYLLEKNKELLIIKEMLEKYNLEIPIIETSTYAYIDDCFDFKDIVINNGANGDYKELTEKYLTEHQKTKMLNS